MHRQIDSRFAELLGRVSQADKVQVPQDSRALYLTPSLHSLPAPWEVALLLAIIQFDMLDPDRSVVGVEEFTSWVRGSTNFWARHACKYYESSDSLMAGLRSLSDANVIDFEYGGFELMLEFEEWAGFKVFWKAFRRKDRRMWLAVLIGDYNLALECLPAGALDWRPELERRQCLWANMRRTVHDVRSMVERDGLNAVHALDETVAMQYVLDSLAGMICWHCARKLVDPMDARWCERAFAVYRDFGNWLATDMQVYALASVLLRHDYRRQEVVDTLEEFKVDRSLRALLLIEFVPEMALPDVRVALRDASWSVIELLAAIDKPWTRRELRSVIEEFSNAEPGTSEAEAATSCLHALAQSQDSATQEWALETWKQRDPGKSYELPDFRILEEEVRELALKIRQQLPDDCGDALGTAPGDVTAQKRLFPTTTMREDVRTAITNGWTYDDDILYHFEHLTQRQTNAIEEVVSGLHVVETMIPYTHAPHRNRYFLRNLPDAIRFAWEMERGDYAEHVVSVRPTLDAEREQEKTLVRYFKAHPEAEAISDEEVAQLSPE